MKVREYWPNFVDRDDKPREQEIAKPEDALAVEWIAIHPHATIDGDYVKSRGWIVGIIVP